MAYRIKKWKYLKTRSKYGNKSTRRGDTIYHSKFEAKVADDLEWRRRSGELVKVERQVRIDLRAYGRHIAFYFVDFRVTHGDGTIEYIEVKGFETDTWKIKWSLFEAQLSETEPEAKLTIIK